MLSSNFHDPRATQEVKRAVINAASSDNTLVAAVTGKKIRVLAALFTLAGTTPTARFESGTGGTALTGVMAPTWSWPGPPPPRRACSFTPKFRPPAAPRNGVADGRHLRSQHDRSVERQNARHRRGRLDHRGPLDLRPGPVCPLCGEPRERQGVEPRRRLARWAGGELLPRPREFVLGGAALEGRHWGGAHRPER
jgi:hypothetical protein